MESSGSETETSLPSSGCCDDAGKDSSYGRTNAQSSDSGVSTSGETSSHEDREPPRLGSSRSGGGTPRFFSSWSRKTSRERLTDKIGGTSALIQYSRPADLPAKSVDEERRHRRQYDAILEQARKREIRETLERRARREESLRREEKFARDSRLWCTEILPRFESLRHSERVRELWWEGLPPSVRGRVWRLAIGNDLGLSEEVYRARSPSTRGEETGEESAIVLDVSRTFANLGVFQAGGPLHESLQNLLVAYARHRSDVGYVQGMSFVGAVLALNMEPENAFVCFANLLEGPCLRAAFALDQCRMNDYYRLFSRVLAHQVPKVYVHFSTNGLSPDMYLLDWLYTVYAKAMPLDLVCRIWDVYVRDGEEFLFRTALGVLRMYQEQLLLMDFVRCSQLLNKLPVDIRADDLFVNIAKTSTSLGARSFDQMISRGS